MEHIDNKQTNEDSVYAENYQISKIVNKIVEKNTPWIWFAIGLIVFIFGEYDIFTIIGACFLSVAFFIGGKQFGHDLGFKDGWYKLENRN